jgi:hypothetical protein
MNNIVLQPTWNKDARTHYVDTIENPIILESISSYITNSEYLDLKDIYPEWKCYIWWVTPGWSNIAKWNRISCWDVTLFSDDWLIHASWVITYKLHSRSLAEKLWWYAWKDEDLKHDWKDETWEHIYFLEEVKLHNIKYIDFNTVVWYASNYRIRWFWVLDNEKSKKIFNYFNFSSNTFIEEITEIGYNNIIDRLESLEETEKEIIWSQRLEQGFLKKYLFWKKIYWKCACCGKLYPVSFLVAAHIKKRSKCTHNERRDKNVVMPMCKFWCDELFEKWYIMAKDWKFITNNKVPTSSGVTKYLSDVEWKDCLYYNGNTKKYFDWHLTYHKN